MTPTRGTTLVAGSIDVTRPLVSSLGPTMAGVAAASQLLGAHVTHRAQRPNLICR